MHMRSAGASMPDQRAEIRARPPGWRVFCSCCLPMKEFARDPPKMQAMVLQGCDDLPAGARERFAHVRWLTEESRAQLFGWATGGIAPSHPDELVDLQTPVFSHARATGRSIGSN